MRPEDVVRSTARTCTRLPGSTMAGDRMPKASSRLTALAAAPRPSDRDSTEMAATAGLPRKDRTAYRRSCRNMVVLCHITTRKRALELTDGRVPCFKRDESCEPMHRESSPRFTDRRAAGKELAASLRHYSGSPDVVVLALPRGGVPVAFAVAGALDAPLDIFLVRKLGLPGHPELAMGAIASGGVRVLNEDVMNWYVVPEAAIEAVARAEQAELERRDREYRQGKPLPDLRGQGGVLGGDGVAARPAAAGRRGGRGPG